jgi:hypothetical protein
MRARLFDIAFDRHVFPANNSRAPPLPKTSRACVNRSSAVPLLDINTSITRGNNFNADRASSNSCRFKQRG